MPAIREFEDIFISYGHIDNRDHWVTGLHSRLQTRVPQILGHDVRIWRDPKIDGADDLWEVLKDRIEHASIFVSILTPRYVQSTACRSEAKCFREVADKTGLKVGNAFRIFRVVKTPYDENLLPPCLKDIDTIGFPFFERHKQDSTRFTEFPADSALPGYDKFYEKSDELAHSICGVLTKMETAAPRNPARPKVFVAEVTSDREADRVFLMNELKKKYDLVPSGGVPPDLGALQARLKDQLRGSVLSIHMLGAKFGLVPEGEESRSIAQIQFELAASVRRLLWIPEDLSDIEPRQDRFISAVKDSNDPNLETVRTGRQAFVRHVLDVLTQLEQPMDAPVYGKAVYLVSNEDDLDRIQLKEIRKCMLDLGVRVEQPVFEGDEEELSQTEQQMLRDTNATVIYYGSARDTWVRNRRMKILKALAQIENGRRHARALYLCLPETRAKRGVYLGLPNGILPEAGGFPPLLILGDCSGFDCSKLDPLLRTLSSEAPS